MVMYMADVIAFFLDGRLNWTRRILPERSVNNVTHLPPPVAAGFQIRSGGDCAARPQTVSDIVSGEAKLFQHFRRYARRFPERAWQVLLVMPCT